VEAHTQNPAHHRKKTETSFTAPTDLFHSDEMGVIQLVFFVPKRLLRKQTQ